VGRFGLIGKSQGKNIPDSEDGVSSLCSICAVGGCKLSSDRWDAWCAHLIWSWSWLDMIAAKTQTIPRTTCRHLSQTS